MCVIALQCIQHFSVWNVWRSGERERYRDRREGEDTHRDRESRRMILCCWESARVELFCHLMLAFSTTCFVELETQAARSHRYTLRQRIARERLKWNDRDSSRFAIEDWIYFIITYNSTLAWLSFSRNQQSLSLWNSHSIDNTLIHRQ